MKALVIYKQGREVERFYPAKRSNVVGRSPSCDIVMRTRGVKSVHYLLEWIGEGEFTQKSGFWSIIDISEASKDGHAGEGVVLSTQAQKFGDLEFAIIEDELAESKLKRGVIRRTVETSKELLAGQLDGGMALEVVYLRKDIDAVVNVKHLVRQPMNIPAVLFPTHPQLKFLWDADSDNVGFIENRGEVGVFQINNRGEDINNQLTQGERKVKFEKHDFITIDTERVEYYLRLVPSIRVNSESGEWRKDPVVQSFIGTAIILLALYFYTQSHPLKLAEPPPPPRVARVEVKEVPPEKPTEVVESKPEPIPELKPEPKQKAAVKAEMAKNEAPKAKPAKASPEVKQEKSGLNVNAPVANVNTMGLLGRLKPTAKATQTISADQVLNQAAVSETATGNSGFVVNKPPMGVVSENPSKNNSPGLAGATTTLQTGKDMAGADVPLNIAGGRGEFGEGATSLGKSGKNGGVEELASGMEVVGGLDKEAVRTAIAENRRAIRNCYEKALFQNKELAGRMVFYWKISAPGTVDNVQLIATDFSKTALPVPVIDRMPEFERCVGRVILAIVFPQSVNGQATIVKYPFVFKGKK
jgi:hypothetical protein